jgi:hypothetical protein
MRMLTSHTYVSWLLREWEHLGRSYDRKIHVTCTCAKYICDLNSKRCRLQNMHFRRASICIPKNSACICMYVCMYVCIYECMYVCIYVCMYVCAYVCVYIYIHTYIHKHPYVHIHTHRVAAAPVPRDGKCLCKYLVKFQLFVSAHMYDLAASDVISMVGIYSHSLMTVRITW